MKIKFRYYLLSATLLTILSFQGCKKEVPTTDPDPTGTDMDGNSLQTPTTDRVELTNDSIFLYAKEIYYWYDDLPVYDTYRPRQYNSAATDLDNYETNLFHIASSNQYDLYTSNNQQYVKYSYIEDVSSAGGISAGIRSLKAGVNLLGQGNDIGIYDVSPYGPSDDDFRLFILAVYPGSPAAKVGLTRGAYITEINGEIIGDNFNEDRQAILSLFDDHANSVTLKGTKVDKSPFTVTLTKESYDSSPIYKDTILNVNGKNIGYLALARFSYDDNANGPLDEAFSQYASKGIEDLVVDLRYNGGGFVNTAEYLADLIVPNGISGTMFVEQYSTLIRNKQANILKNQPVRDEEGNVVGSATYFDLFNTATEDDFTTKFAKKGSLGGLKNVVFLVSGGTASASELLINSLRAVNSLNVKIVGTTTYGKPVGFFPVRLEGKYDLYLPSFSTKNADGQGDYYAGFKPGTDIPGKEVLDEFKQDADLTSDFDFGDPQEAYLQEALNQLGVINSSRMAAGPLMSIQSRNRNSTSKKLILGLDRPKKEFNGMIEMRVTR